MLDTGTDNPALLAEDMYLGNRHPRVRGERYDELIDAYVSTATRLFPNAMLHWEDFGAANARRILLKYADTCCTFNDDMQGTAAVVLAAALCAIRAAGTRMRDQTVVIHGAGTAGIGIADALRQVMIDDGLSPDEATARFYALGSKGLLTTDYPGTLRDFQVPYARPAAEVASWQRDAGRPHRPGRGGDPQPAHHADRDLDPARSLLRGDRHRDGGTRRPADHHAAVQPDLALRGPARRPDRLDRRPGAHRDRQPVPAGHLRRSPSTRSPRPTTRSSSPASGSGSPSAGPAASATACWPPRPARWPACPTPTAPGAAVLPPVTSLRERVRRGREAVARAAQAEGLSDVPLDGLAERVRQAMWEPAYPKVEAI